MSTQATVFVATAAVADWRPATAADQKIKKDGSGDAPELRFIENPDILATVAQSPRGQRGSGDLLFCVGFAAESHDLLAHARAKRARKGVPLLVGNIGPATFGQDDNALLLVDAQGATEAAARVQARACSQTGRRDRPTDAGTRAKNNENRRQDPRPAHGRAAARLRHARQRRPGPARLPGLRR